MKLAELATRRKGKAICQHYSESLKRSNNDAQFSISFLAVLGKANKFILLQFSYTFLSMITVHKL